MCLGDLVRVTGGSAEAMHENVAISALIVPRAFPSRPIKVHVHRKAVKRCILSFPNDTA